MIIFTPDNGRIDRVIMLLLALIVIGLKLIGLLLWDWVMVLLPAGSLVFIYGLSAVVDLIMKD